MLTKRHNSQQFQKMTRIVAMWFIFFAIVVPALHRHGGSAGALSPLIAKVKSVGHRHAASTLPAIDSASGSLASPDDDCALCQWFSVGFTPSTTQVLLFATTLSALLVLSVRLLALCQRPLPRRGLRGPPALFA